MRLRAFRVLAALALSLWVCAAGIGDLVALEDEPDAGLLTDLPRLWFDCQWYSRRAGGIEDVRTIAAQVDEASRRLADSPKSTGARFRLARALWTLRDEPACDRHLDSLIDAGDSALGGGRSNAVEVERVARAAIARGDVATFERAFSVLQKNPSTAWRAHALRGEAEIVQAVSELADTRLFDVDLAWEVLGFMFVLGPRALSDGDRAEREQAPRRVWQTRARFDKAVAASPSPGRQSDTRARGEALLARAQFELSCASSIPSTVLGVESSERVAAALDDLRRARELLPDDPRALALLLSGVTRSPGTGDRRRRARRVSSLPAGTRSRVEAAIQGLTQLADQASGDASAFAATTLAAYHLDVTDDVDRAEVFLRLAVRSGPTEDRALEVLVQLLFSQRRFADAVSTLSELPQSTSSSRVCALLATALERGGARAAARKVWTRGTRLDEEHFECLVGVAAWGCRNGKGANATLLEIVDAADALRNRVNGDEVWRQLDVARLRAHHFAATGRDRDARREARRIARALPDPKMLDALTRRLDRRMDPKDVRPGGTAGSHDAPETVLADFATWLAASSDERVLAARAVADRLEGVRLLRRLAPVDDGERHVPLLLHESTGIEFVLIPAGTFDMGSHEDEVGRVPNERLHRVTLTRPFLLARYECTQRAWDRIGGEDERAHALPRAPIDGVSWTDATAWCERAGVRLPTEAEWEYSCRAGTTTAFHVGDALGVDDANVRRGAPSSTSARREESSALPVGLYCANRLGLHDMHGNLLEWCVDAFASNYPEFPARDPVASAETDARVARGGHYYGDASMARSAHRSGGARNSHLPTIGFRPAMSVPPR